MVCRSKHHSSLILVLTWIPHPSLQRIHALRPLLGVVQIPCTLLPRHVACSVHPCPAQEVHAALQPPPRELRGRCEALAAVPCERVLAEWRTVGGGWDVPVCQRKSSMSPTHQACGRYALSDALRRLSMSIPHPCCSPENPDPGG